jgi:putative membrane protein
MGGADEDLMVRESGVTRGQSFVLWATFLVYVAGRVCQQYPDKIPVLAIVAMQVLTPAIFALVHGKIRYGVRGMLVFTGFCMGVGGVSESLSLRTGFPFGHYVFTGLMGPKVLDLPILLVLAYLGIGYCSWVLGRLILGYRDKPLAGMRVVALPLLAGLIMTAWDLSMDPIWATLDRAWIWRDGGSFYGVPWSNFAGWYLTAFVFYLAFSLYCRAYPGQRKVESPGYWRVAILFYGVCAVGNLLVFRPGLFPAAAVDAAGRQWVTGDILLASVLVSLLGMTPMAVVAWVRVGRQEARVVEG